MREGSKLVLQLLADGRISVDEAYDLLSALNAGPDTPPDPREQSEPREQSRPSWFWEQPGMPFSSLSPADVLALIFEGLAAARQRQRDADYN